jgi:hypothetical protein
MFMIQSSKSTYRKVEEAQLECLSTGSFTGCFPVCLLMSLRLSVRMAHAWQYMAEMKMNCVATSGRPEALCRLSKQAGRLFIQCIQAGRDIQQKAWGQAEASSQVVLMSS